MRQIEIGSKVQYMHTGDWHEGVVHGYQVHEDENQQPLAINYIIDTGEDERIDHVGYNEDNEPITFRQPELLTIDQNFVKPLE